jgi:hypothetical protein
MRKIMGSFLITLMVAAGAFAGSVDGKWTGEMNREGGKKADQKRRTLPVTLTLTSEDGVLKGTLKASAGKKAEAEEIRHGKLEGDRIYFQTVRKTKKGEQAVRWEGKLEGDELKMVQQGKGKKSGTEFTLKRAG